MGPDGAISVSDWHDSRTAHPDPDAEWDRSNGRIYRVAAKGTARAASIDFAKLPTEKLINLLRHRSQWYVRRARMELAERRTGKTELMKMLDDPSEEVALEGLWSLNAISEFNETLADETLKSPHAAVRGWTVRLLGDSRQISSEMAHRLDKFAEKEPDARVRRQIASSAARFPANQALPMINANINRDIDYDDPAIPLLWWWAVEKHSVSGRDEVMRRFVRPSLWKSRLGRDVLLPRLTRRYAAEEKGSGLESVVKLLKAAPDDAARDALWLPILQGRNEVPTDQSSLAVQNAESLRELQQMVNDRWKAKPADLTLLKLALSLGDRTALKFAFEDAVNPKLDPNRRIALLELLAHHAEPSFIDPMLTIIASETPESVRVAALRLLGRFDDERIAVSMLKLHQANSSEILKSQIRDILLGRKSSAKVWLGAVDQGDIPAAVTPVEQVQRIGNLEDSELDALVRKHWGQLGMTKGEKLAEVRRLNNDLRASTGNPLAGQLVYKANCASCHQLFGEGTKLGPDLTTANRKDRDFMLISLVDPSSVIRKEFSSVVVQTKDGRVLTGLAVARDDAGVTLINGKNEKTTVPASEIEDVHESAVSLMPDDLYKKLSPQQLRDLFSYLESNGK